MRAPPLDYAVGDDGSGLDAAPRAASGDVTLAALLNRDAAAPPVTDAMIRDAWRRMESEHRLGFDAGEPDDAPELGRRLARLFRTGG